MNGKLTKRVKSIIMLFKWKLIALALLFIALPIIINFGWQVYLTRTALSLPGRATVGESSMYGLPQGSYYEVSVPFALLTDKLAHYRLWIPARSESLRGLLIKQHGCGAGADARGLEHANDLQWQTLAAKHNFALLGTRMTTGDQPCEDWALINNGSRKVFLKALQTFAEKARRPELKDIPWVLWGHSGGADWVAQMLQEYPDRTIAMVGVRGGASLIFQSNPALAGIPVLFTVGERDPYASETVEFPQRAVARYRAINAPWSIAMEPDAQHEAGNSRFLIIPYLDAVIGQRLFKPGQPLQPVASSNGWLGNTGTHAVAPAPQYKDDPLQAVWLPNEAVARQWQEYVGQGQVMPTRKPAAPTEVHASKLTGQDVVITWNYQPDLENGLPAFRVYRDGSSIATLKGQEHDFGDSPQSTNFALQFSDKNGRPESTYAVAAVNALGETVSSKTPVIEGK